MRLKYILNKKPWSHQCMSLPVHFRTSILHMSLSKFKHVHKNCIYIDYVYHFTDIEVYVFFHISTSLFLWAYKMQNDASQNILEQASHIAHSHPNEMHCLVKIFNYLKINGKKKMKWKVFLKSNVTTKIKFVYNI